MMDNWWLNDSKLMASKVVAYWMVNQLLINGKLMGSWCVTDGSMMAREWLSHGKIMVRCGYVMVELHLNRTAK